MIYIVYPPGGHGNFLKLLLNEITGHWAIEANKSYYDRVSFSNGSIASTKHRLPSDVDLSQVLNIRVSTNSYLKYFAMCLTRTAGQDLIIEDLCFDTFEKLKHHSVMLHFCQSLEKISNSKEKNIEPKYLREWFRLCFFADNGKTITNFIEPNIVAYPKYIVDFELFYNDKILDFCTKICENYKLPVVAYSEAKKRLEEFCKKNRYYNIDLNIPTILNCINNQTYFDLSDTNILQQAWIDNYLSTKYNVNPLLKNSYFNNTIELVETYQLKV